MEANENSYCSNACRGIEPAYARQPESRLILAVEQPKGTPMKQKGIRQTGGGTANRRRRSQSSARPKRASEAASRGSGEGVPARNSPRSAEVGRRGARPSFPNSQHRIARRLWARQF